MQDSTPPPPPTVEFSLTLPGCPLNPCGPPFASRSASVSFILYGLGVRIHWRSIIFSGFSPDSGKFLRRVVLRIPGTLSVPTLLPHLCSPHSGSGQFTLVLDLLVSYFSVLLLPFGNFFLFGTLPPSSDYLGRVAASIRRPLTPSSPLT